MDPPSESEPPSNEISSETKIIPDEAGFLLRFCINKVKVVIDSRIDSKDLKQALSDCDLIICVTDYKAPSIKELKELAKNSSSRLVWTAPYEIDAEENQQFQDNLTKLKAQHILDMVARLGILN